MEITKQQRQLFCREVFSFKQLKAVSSPEEVAAIKADFQENWQQWKALQLATAELLPKELGLSRPKIESWTNGWNLRNHFWGAYRSQWRQAENPCLATLLNRKQYQVYLMFQHYKSEERKGSLADYQRVLTRLPQWAKDRDIRDYYIWPQQESEWADHLPLQEYLASPSLQKAFLTANERSFQIGKLFFDEVPEAPVVTAATLMELWPLYQETAIKASH